MLDNLTLLASLFAIVFGWAMVATVTLLAIWLTLYMRNSLDSLNILRVAEYTFIVAIVFGSGLIVLGGVVVGWDVLLQVRGDGTNDTQISSTQPR